MAACSGNNMEPEIIIEPGGSAHYYINNQSHVEFNVLYTRLGSQADSLKTIPSDTTVILLKDGTFGGNPSPSTSFSQILFYKLPADSSKPVLTIDPDEEWIIIGRKGFEDSDFGLTEYEFVITDDDIN